MATTEIAALAETAENVLNSVPLASMVVLAIPPALYVVANIIEGSWTMAPSEAMVVISLLGFAGFIGQTIGSQQLKRLDREVYLPEVALPIGGVLAITWFVTATFLPPTNTAIYQTLGQLGLR